MLNSMQLERSLGIVTMVQRNMSSQLYNETKQAEMKSFAVIRAPPLWP